MLNIRKRVQQIATKLLLIQIINFLVFLILMLEELIGIQIDCTLKVLWMINFTILK